MGFEMRSNVDDDLEVTIVCLSDGVLVGSFTFPTPTHIDFAFYAFESVATFDEVLIDTQNDNSGAWRMDNLRYEFKEPIKLIQDVQALGLPGRAGQAQLSAALDALAQDPPDIQGAIDALQDFINFVNAQSGKLIPFEDADDLINDAQVTIDLLTG